MPKPPHWSVSISDTISVCLDAIERVAQTDAPDKGQLKELGDCVTKLTEAEQGYKLLDAKLRGARVVDGD